MTDVKLEAVLALVEAFNEHLAKIEEHVGEANLLWFRNLAIQEWYEELLTLVTKPRSEVIE